jgi:hypothetical protein
MDILYCHVSYLALPYHTPGRTMSQLKKHSHWVMTTGGLPETISNQWNSVTYLFSKMATRGEKSRSFDATASPQPVVFTLLSWKVVFFELWHRSSRGAITSPHYPMNCTILKQNLLNIKRGLIFYTALPEHFSFRKQFNWILSQEYAGLHIKYLLLLPDSN